MPELPPSTRFSEWDGVGTEGDDDISWMSGRAATGALDCNGSAEDGVNESGLT